MLADWDSIEPGAAAAPTMPDDVHLRVTFSTTSPFTAGHRSRLECLVIDCQT